MDVPQDSKRLIAKKSIRYLGALKNSLVYLGDAYSQNHNLKEARKYCKEALKIVKSRIYRKQIVSSRAIKEKKQLEAKL